MRWGLIGASNIAGEWMVGALRAVGDEPVAVVSGSLDRARAFAQQHGCFANEEIESDRNAEKSHRDTKDPYCTHGEVGIPDPVQKASLKVLSHERLPPPRGSRHRRFKTAHSDQFS